MAFLHCEILPSNYEPGNTVKSLNADYLIIYLIQELVQILEKLIYLNVFEQYDWHNGKNNNLYRLGILY